MGQTRPRTARAKRLKRKRCPKCGKLIAANRKRCQRCHGIQVRI